MDKIKIAEYKISFSFRMRLESKFNHAQPKSLEYTEQNFLGSLQPIESLCRYVFKICLKTFCDLLDS